MHSEVLIHLGDLARHRHQHYDAVYLVDLQASNRVPVRLPARTPVATQHGLAELQMRNLLIVVVEPRDPVTMRSIRRALNLDTV